MTEERNIAISRRARYYVLGEIGPKITDVWFVCHGYGQLASTFIREFDCIAAPFRLIVAPEALSRYYVSTAPGFHGKEAEVGATWMTREDRETEIGDYVGYLDSLHAEIMGQLSQPQVQVTVLGFSQGGATANRWLTRGKATADRLLMWGSLLASDADLNEAAAFFRKVKLILVYGTRDQYANTGMIADYERVLTEKGIPYELITFDGGHRLDRGTLAEVAPMAQTKTPMTPINSQTPLGSGDRVDLLAH
ncbi:MAG: phospholipase [Gemmatimonadaceae bacterium]